MRNRLSKHFLFPAVFCLLLVGMTSVPCPAQGPGPEVDKVADTLGSVLNGEPPAPASKGSPAEEHYYSGKSLAKVGEYDKAIEELKRAVELQPDDGFYVRDLGHAYYAAGRYEAAANAYEKALSLLSPWGLRGTADIYGKYAYACFMTKRYKDALDAYRTLIKLYPRDTTSLYMAGLCHFNLRQYPEAVAALSSFAQTNYDDPLAYYWLGYAYQNNKEYQNAEAAYLTALKLQPDNADVYFNLGLVYLALEKYSDAKNAYKMVLQLDKDNAEALLNLGIVYERQGEIVVASDYYYRAGMIFLEKKNREGALLALNNLKHASSPLYEELHFMIYPGVILKGKKEGQ